MTDQNQAPASSVDAASFDDAATCWSDLLGPMTRRLEVAAALPGHDACWNSVGADAFARLLKDMAQRLDVTAPAEMAAKDAEIVELLALLARSKDVIERLHADRTRLKDAVRALGGDPDAP